MAELTDDAGDLLAIGDYEGAGIGLLEASEALRIAAHMVEARISPTGR